MDLGHDQLTLASRFMQDSVRAFSVEVYMPWAEPWRRGPLRLHGPMNQFEAHVAKDQNASCNPWDPVQMDPSMIPLLCGLVSSSMRHIKHLKFYVEEPEIALLTYQDTIEMVISLSGLQTLGLSAHSCTLPIVQRLAPCTLLREIIALRPGFQLHQAHGRSVHYEDIMCSNLLQINGGHLSLKVHELRSLTTLTLSAELPWLTNSIRGWPAGTLPNVRTLSVLGSSQWCEILNDEDVTRLFRAVGDSFKSLEHLCVGPIRTIDEANRPWRVTEGTLASLSDCGGLLSLEIGADCFSCVAVEGWARLLPSWPKLQRLLLENTTSKRSIDPPSAVSNIDSVLATFAKHCPDMRVLSLSVRPLVESSPSSWLSNHAPVRLEVLELSTYYPTGRDAITIAKYLDAVLHPWCQLRIACHGGWDFSENKVLEEFASLRYGKYGRQYSPTYSRLTRTLVLTPQDILARLDKSVGGLRNNPDKPSAY